MATERQNAKIARVSDLVSAKFFQGNMEEMKPSYVITRFGESIARARLVASVTEKFLSEDGRFASLTLDDGTEAIRVRVFANDSRLIEEINPGDLVSVVGKMKNFRDENYIAPDFVRSLEDPNHEILFKLELLEDISEKKKIADDLRGMKDQMSEEELSEYAAEKYQMDAQTLQVIIQSEGEQVDYKPLMLGIMDKLDKGEGVEIGKLLEASKLDESMAERAINELLESGDVYEPTVGKLRKVTA